MLVRAHKATSLAHDTQALPRQCQSIKTEGAMAPDRQRGCVRPALLIPKLSMREQPSPFVQSILLGFQPHSPNCCTALHAGFLPFKCHLHSQPSFPFLGPLPLPGPLNAPIPSALWAE